MYFEYNASLHDSCCMTVSHPSSESHQRYLMEHGYLLHSAGLKQIEDAISEGRLDPDDWQYLYTVIAKNMGHFCMVLHTVVSVEVPR